MIRRYILILIALISVSIVFADRTQRSIKLEQQRTKKEIKETAKKIATTQKKTKEQVNLLNTLAIEIKENSEAIEKLKLSIDSINSSMSVVNDSILILEQNLSNLRNKYIDVLRSIRASKHLTSNVSFIFSAESLSDAYRRIRYLNQFASWQTNKAAEIKNALTAVNNAKEKLIGLHSEKVSSMKEMSSIRQTLQSNEKRQEKVIASLNKEEKSLKAYMKKKQQEARALDTELENLIAEEQRKKEAERKRKEAEKKRKEQEKAQKGKINDSKVDKDANKKKVSKDIIEPDIDRKLSGSFANNKGKLPYPVNGKCRIVGKFGRHQHPELKYIETENSGIDIELISAGNARAVFEGTVSAIFKQPGYNNIVMVRHGEYLTIYANLETLNIKPGDKVKANQILGSIYADPDNENRRILHFEVRKETQKLNPQNWIK